MTKKLLFVLLIILLSIQQICFATEWKFCHAKNYNVHYSLPVSFTEFYPNIPFSEFAAIDRNTNFSSQLMIVDPTRDPKFSQYKLPKSFSSMSPNELDRYTQNMLNGIRRHGYDFKDMLIDVNGRTCFFIGYYLDKNYVKYEALQFIFLENYKTISLQFVFPANASDSFVDISFAAANSLYLDYI